MEKALPCLVPCLVLVACVVLVVFGMKWVAKKTFYAPVPSGLNPTSPESAEFWDTGADRARLRQKLLIVVAAVFFLGQGAGYYANKAYQKSLIPPPPTVKEIVDATMTAIYAQTPTGIYTPTETPTP